jgi:hypothetical protein
MIQIYVGAAGGNQNGDCHFNLEALASDGQTAKPVFEGSRLLRLSAAGLRNPGNERRAQLRGLLLKGRLNYAAMSA